MKIFHSGLDSTTQQYLQSRGLCLCTDDDVQSATELMDVASMENVDLFLINLDKTPWFELQVAKIRSRGCNIPIIGLSSNNVEEHSRRRAIFLDAGGDDFFSIPFDHQELLASMRAIVRRCVGWSSNMLEFTAPGTVLKIHTHSREILLNQIPFDALTGTENAILVTLAEHASGWCSTDYLVQKLYDINDEPVTNIVQVFISKIRKKLNGISPGASEILQTRCRMGYRLCSVE